MPATRSTTRSPRITPLAFGILHDGDPADLMKDADLDGVLFPGLTVDALSLPGALLDEVQFQGTNAGEADFKGSRFHEVDLDQVHFPVVRASRSQWRDVQVRGRVGGFEAYEAQWRSVHFVGCKLDYLNLRNAELVDVAFTDCFIGEIDLLDAVARRVAFNGTRITSLNVQRATLRDVDLRQADMDSIDGLMNLGGATMTGNQLSLLAPLFAAHVGITVED